MQGRVTVAVGAALLSLLALAPSAQAKQANFIARLSATYTAGGTVSANCPRPTEDNSDAYVTLTGTAQERSNLVTTAAQKISVSQFSRFPVSAGAYRLIGVRIRAQRSGNLAHGTQPRGCDLRGFDPAPDCGTKTRNYTVNVYGTGRGNRAGLGFRIIRRGFTVWRGGPTDPFTGCDLPEGTPWMGFQHINTKPGTVREARLFNPRVRTIVVSSTLTGNPRSGATGENAYRASSTFSLRYTLTLTRTR